MRIVFRTESQTDPERRSSERGTSRSFRIAVFLVVGCSILSILVSFMGDGGIMTIYQQSQVKEELRFRIAAEEARRLVLLARVEALKKDPVELERIAREELGMVRPNEMVYDFRESGRY